MDSRNVTHWGMIVGFSLTENAFARLGVSIRTRSEKIEEAFEDAVIEKPALEAKLLKTKQEITFPKLRLESEVRWLIDMAPNKAEQVIETLKDNNLQQTLRFLNEDAIGLSAANIAADACGRFDPDVFIDRLIDTHATIETVRVSDEINSARAVSGFSQVALAQVRDALTGVTTEHAQAVVESLARRANPGPTLAKLTSTRSGPFIDVLIETYDRWAAPKLREVEEGAVHFLKLIDETGEGNVAQAVTKLKEWSQISEPVQRHHEAKGLDEPRSLKLYYASRSASISLANNHQHYEAADNLTSAMSEIFERLPSAKKQLAIDLETLGELRQDVAREALVSPLGDQISKLGAKISQTADLLETQDWQSDNLVDLDRAFDQARRGGDVDDLVLELVRSLALKLNAENYPRAAYVLLHRYLDKLPDLDPGLALTSANELSILRSNADQKELIRALKQEQFDVADKLVTSLLSYDQDETLRGQLLQIRGQIDKRKSDRAAKIIGWVILIVIGAVLFLVSQANQSSPQPQTDYYAADDFSGATGAAADAPVDVPAEQTFGAPTDPYVDPYAEQYVDPYAQSPTPPPIPPVNTAVPSAGAGPVYSQYEIESCLEEEAILNRLRGMTSSDNAIDRFNARISSYNARCGSYQYRLDDMTRAQAAVSAQSAVISAEAKRLADEWSYE
ncbi:hypothetical protein [Brevundimonas sp.]|uniref:hypothetical protein n=1 Tax=Brevundimonas sp. TaxID=1871086 RepID=UPI00356A567F